MMGLEAGIGSTEGEKIAILLIEYERSAALKTLPIFLFVRHQTTFEKGERRSEIQDINM